MKKQKCLKPSYTDGNINNRRKMAKCRCCNGTGQCIGAEKSVFSKCPVCDGKGVLEKVKRGRHRHKPGLTSALEHNCQTCYHDYLSCLAHIG